jgi:transposase
VCRDLWQPYLKVLARRAAQALHILDRFPITMHLNQAVDEVRRAESTRLKGQPLARRLKKMRWKWLRKGSTVRGRAKVKWEGLLAGRLATGRAWDLKEAFQHFWTYRSPVWAGGFWDYWTQRAMRSRTVTNIFVLFRVVRVIVVKISPLFLGLLRLSAAKSPFPPCLSPFPISAFAF